MSGKIIVTVVFLGVFARITGEKELHLKLDQTLTIKELTLLVSERVDPKHRSLFTDAFVTREGLKMNPSAEIEDGDRFVFMLPIASGG